MEDLCKELINEFNIKVLDNFENKNDGILTKRTKSQIKNVLNSINNKKNNEIEKIKKFILSAIEEEVEIIFDKSYNNNNKLHNDNYINSSFADELKIAEFIKNKDISIFFKINNDKDILLLENKIKENKEQFNLKIQNSNQYVKYFNETKIEIDLNNLKNNLDNLKDVLEEFRKLTFIEKIYQPCFLSALIIIKLFNENKMNDIEYLKKIFYDKNYIFKSYFSFSDQIDFFEILQMHKLFNNKILEIFRKQNIICSDLLEENYNFLKNAKIFNNLKNNIYIVQRQVGNIDENNNFRPNIGSHFYLIIDNYIINPYSEHFKFVKKENFYELIEDSNEKNRRIKLTFIPINKNLLDILIKYQK